MEAFLVSTGVVALGEMGDKTQLLAMLLANVPAVYLGDKVAAKVSMRLVHAAAALIFAVLGALTLAGFQESAGLH
jgi:putative Ca2+/H+ antiporter (TMEM165/GDT1 family)